MWNLSYIFHMHTFKQALLNPLIAFTTNVLWCFECFVVYRKFVHVKTIDIFWSNALVGRLCALISLLRFYKSDPFKFFGNFTDVSITGHVTVIWSPVAKIALEYCSVCCKTVAVVRLCWCICCDRRQWLIRGYVTRVRMTIWIKIRYVWKHSESCGRLVNLQVI